MPRAFLPGRISGKRRAHYTARRRVALLASARRIQEEEGLSLRAVADQLRVDHSTLEGPHRDRRYILNMDQTPVYFLMSKKRTLEIVGAKTVYIRTSTNDTKRATVAVTIAADGTLLPSTVVFKREAR